MTPAEWEAAWAPYDEATYGAALDFLRPDDVVLDIGAGDLRFARRASARVRHTIAIEQRTQLLSLTPGPSPPNLTVICADARRFPFPPGLTVGVLLMRHCCHVGEYAARLRAAGCARLITNARWGMGVEIIDLHAPRAARAGIVAGWYACLCGGTGFIAAAPGCITAATLQQIHEVSACSACLIGA
ncbi:MAG: rRNA adenine methyltransferase [Chloroflexi bacterium]|nr:rRNA adenine methyltransferase [Chloroflexota bacterium]